MLRSTLRGTPPFISAVLPPCFARWTLSFLSDKRLLGFLLQKSLLWRPSRCSTRVHSWPCIFSLLINDLPASLPSFVSCSLYADDLAIWSSSPSVPAAVEAKQGGLIQQERWSEYWRLPLNLCKCEASFFSVDSHQANLQPHLLLFNSSFRFNYTPTFLVVSLDRTLSFCKHVSLLKAKFFPRPNSIRCISASTLRLFYEPLSINLFFGSLSLMPIPDVSFS